MSSDKLYTNLSTLVEFYMGERPSADKFNAVNKYFSRGFIEQSKAIGDIYDAGLPHLFDSQASVSSNLSSAWNIYDSTAKSRPSDIANLARIIGPASNLNARMFTNSTALADSKEITETIPVATLEYECNFKIKFANNQPYLLVVPGYTFTAGSSFSTSAQFRVINEKTILFSNKTTTEIDITYRTDPYDYFGGIDYLHSGFNVIPDPNQGAGLTITLHDSTIPEYKIVFPVISAQQSGISTTAALKDKSIDTSGEFNNTKHYELPLWLTTQLDAMAEPKIIPSNFLYLKNRETSEVFLDAVYEYIDSKTIHVTNIELCLKDGDPINVDGDFCIVTVGSNITTAIDDLRVKWFKHTHDGTFGESFISIEDLSDKFKYEPPSGIYGPSGLTWNQMPMYLHRDGYYSDSNTSNGNNAMRGPLFMGLDTFHSRINPVIANDVGISHPIYFGSENVYIKKNGDLLYLRNKLSNGTIELNANHSINGSASAGDVNFVATVGSINLTATEEKVAITADTISFNESCYIEDDAFPDVTTDYSDGTNDLTIDNGKYDFFKKDYLIEKHKQPSISGWLARKAGDPLPAPEPLSSVWHNAKHNSTTLYQYENLVVNDVDFYHQANEEITLIFPDVTYNIANYKSSNTVSFANIAPCFFMNLSLHHEESFENLSSYFKESEYLIGSNVNDCKYEMSLIDTYIYLYRGMAHLDGYQNNNYYSKKVGYIKSDYGTLCPVGFQASVNVQYHYENSANNQIFTIKKNAPNGGQDLFESASPLPLSILGNYTIYEEELASNQLHYVLDYRNKFTADGFPRAYKDPADISYDSIFYPTKLIVSASANSSPGIKHQANYNSSSSNTFSNPTNSLYSTDGSKTIDYRDFVKSSGDLGSNIISLGQVNLTAIFIDLILGDSQHFPAPGATGYVSKHFDFDVKIIEERIADLLLLDVQFLNIVEIT